MHAVTVMTAVEAGDIGGERPVADGLESRERGDDTPDAGQEGMHAHVVGNPVRRSKLGHPQAPGDVAAGVAGGASAGSLHDQAERAAQPAADRLHVLAAEEKISSTADHAPGAAEAVKQAGKTGKVKVIGLGLPNENKAYVKAGVTDSVILWKTEDLGRLTVQAAVALAQGKLKKGDTSFASAGLGNIEIQGDNILLGKPFIFNAGNIDQFNF